MMMFRESAAGVRMLGVAWMVGVCLQASVALGQQVEVAQAAPQPPDATPITPQQPDAPSTAPKPDDVPRRGLLPPDARSSKDGQSLVFSLGAFEAYDDNILGDLSG